VVPRDTAGGDVSAGTPDAAPPLVDWRAGLTHARRALAWLDGARPAYVLAGFVVAEWLVTLGVALTVRHNGWLYYQGGDELWHYVTSWLLVHGRLAHTSVGYGWVVVLLPFAAVGGPDLVSPLPFIVLLDVLVLMPVALLSTYGIGRRLGGRLFGYWCAALWILVPLIGIKYTDAGYHQRYTELLLPQSLGLTGMSDFPGMVGGAAAAYFTLRAVQEDSPWDGVLAGLLAGVVLGIKPSNAPLVVGMALALLYARRWRGLAYSVAGLAPGVLALAVWKARGEGNLPLFRSAAGTGLVAAHVAPVLGLGLHTYVSPSWSFFTAELHDIEQHFWSVRLIEWFALAGVVGLLRRSRPAGLLFGGWLFSMIVVKWTSPGHGTIADSDLLRQTIPAIPAALMAIAGLLFLFPGMPQRMQAPPHGEWGSHRLRVGVVAALVTLFAIVPMGLAALPRLSNSDTLSYYTQSGASLSAPFAVDSSWKLSVSHTGRTYHLSWPRLAPLGGTLDYNLVLAPADQAIVCDVTGGGAQCRVNGSVVSATHGTTYTATLSPGTWTYRILATGSWVNQPTAGNVFVAGPPVTVTVR
jgi:Dolichyl-phosphate-mannose-protein mannosyltransferase